MIGSKFNKGEKVKYIPKLSGFNNNKPLTISHVCFKAHDELHEALNLEFIPTYLYSFEGTNLTAIESDLIKA